MNESVMLDDHLRSMLGECKAGEEKALKVKFLKSKEGKVTISIVEDEEKEKETEGKAHDKAEKTEKKKAKAKTRIPPIVQEILQEV